MMHSVGTHLPAGWSVAKISELAEINPRLEAPAHAASSTVSFVPMTAVEAETGAIDLSRTRHLSEVRNGYRYFRARDVLFAKITPCMENGKMVVVPRLEHGLGFGSTEFHVLRPHREISPDYLYRFVSAAPFRRDAEHHMTGAVGQRRVPTSYLAEQRIPLPPATEQRRIATKIEELFSELEKGIESLKKARAQLATYRQAVLKHAFEGKLTAQWREENKDRLETPEQLIARIKQKREAHYEQQLQEWRTAVMSWEQGGKSGRRPSKPSEFKVTERIEQDELTDLPHLPRSWQYVRLSEIADIGSGISVSRSRKLDDPIEVPYLSVANVQRGELDLSRVKTMLIERAQLAALELKQRDVLFNEGGDRDKLGRGWIWESQMEHCITQNHVFRASPFLGFHEHSKWMSHWANSFGQKYFEAQGKQTTNLASINKTVLSNFPIPLPPVREQVETLRRIDIETSILDHVESSITAAFRNLSGLRQSILKTAFSGQLVPQDPRDEPASFLLDRIKTEREQIPSRVMRRKTAEREKTKVTA